MNKCEFYPLATELLNAQKLLESSENIGWLRTFWGVGAKVAVVVVLTLVCIVGVSIGAVLVFKGYGINGNVYLTMSEESKVAYTTGIVDGIYLAPLFGAPERSILWVANFTKGMNAIQVTAIVNKYMKENPQLWHKGMNTLVYSALEEVSQGSR